MAHTIGIVCSLGVGPTRGGRARNEDNYLVCKGTEVTYLDGDRERRDVAHGEGTLLAVCDGMGGHDDGHVAAATAARVLARLYRPGAPRDPAAALRKYLLDAHRRLHARAAQQGPVTMGTTVTAVWLLGGSAVWAQVGDSRLFLFRDDSLRAVSPLHVLNTFRARDGQPDHPDGDRLCQSFIYGSRGLTNDAELRLDPVFDVGTLSLLSGDRLVLCSDGLSDWVEAASIADVLRNTQDPQAAAVALMERAIARGSTDNITVVIARVDGDPTSEALVFGDDHEDLTVMF